MTTLTPAGTSGIDSDIQLYDHEIKAITEGPLLWANEQEGTWRNIDDFFNQLTDKFRNINLVVDIKVFQVGECKCRLSSHPATSCPNLIPVPDAYNFEGTILGRVREESGFDYDKMKHEVQTNLLGIPGEEGSIKFDPAEFVKKHGTGHQH